LNPRTGRLPGILLSSKWKDQIAVLFALRLATLVGAGLVASACPISTAQAALMFVQACATISSQDQGAKARSAAGDARGEVPDGA
jgi:hypothetical protein